MLRKSLDEITKQDITHFVAEAAIQESASLDYKRDYDLSNSKSKKGFLGDICALANNGGGHLLVGVDEERDEDDQKSGLPTDPPRGAKAFDKSVAEDIIHASIDPRIGSFVHIKSVLGEWEDGPVHIIRVDRTWNPPHSVTSGDRRTFYRRSGTKSEPMTTDQIRDAFVGAAGLGERIREFHRGRVQRVLDGVTTFPLEPSKGLSIVHVVPLSYFASGDQLNLDGVPQLQPSRAESGFSKLVPNFDGRIAYAKSSEVTSYIQVFRHGAVESVDTDLAYELGNKLMLRVHQIEIDVLRTLAQAKIFFDSQSDVELPCLVMLSVVDVKGSRVPPPDPGCPTGHIHPIELDRLEFPDIQIDDLNSDFTQLLRPMFDMLWQASGWTKSASFDEHGRYTKQW